MSVVSALMLVVFVILGITTYFRIRTKHMRLAAPILEEFHELSIKLMGDREVPEYVAELLHALNKDVLNHSFIRSIFKLAFSGKLRVIKEEYSKSDFAKAYKTMPKEQQKGFDKVTFLYFLAATYNNMILGTIIRRLVLWAVTANDKDASVAVVSTHSNEAKGFAVA